MSELLLTDNFSIELRTFCLELLIENKVTINIDTTMLKITGKIILNLYEKCDINCFIELYIGKDIRTSSK